MSEPSLSGIDHGGTGCSMHEPYALQVLGDDMAPEFPDRCVVIVEPTDRRRNGTYVFAEVEGVRWLRQYVKDTDGHEWLRPENRIYPEIALDGLDWQVLGVVIQRNIRRKIKHYDYSQVPELTPTVPIVDLTGR